jgi:hypothetical protein
MNAYDAKILAEKIPQPKELYLFLKEIEECAKKGELHLKIEKSSNCEIDTKLYDEFVQDEKNLTRFLKNLGYAVNHNDEEKYVFISWKGSFIDRICCLVFGPSGERSTMSYY